MKTKTIRIVDLGRGPQLSTSRITVLDLVHYLRRGASHEEIMRWIPTLTQEEISVVEHYYLEHKEECDARDCRAREYRQEQIRLQRLRFPEFTGTSEEHVSRLKQLLETRRQEKNGERHPG